MQTNTKYTIEDMQKLGFDKGGECLSKKYTGIFSKLEWKCCRNHIWKATPHNIKKNRWCPICRHKEGGLKKRLGIEQMQDIAKSKDGLCISTEYHGNHKKLLWQCKEGHVWSAEPNSIKQGTWCPTCAIKINGIKKRRTIEEMHEYAKSKEGLCLSTEYKNNRTKLKWQCKEGHVFYSIPEIVSRRTWCLECGYKKTTDSKRGCLKDMQELAKIKEGLCLSTHYISSDGILIWQCKEKHSWGAVPNSVQQGHWCPICSEGIGEKTCHKLFEKIYNKKFYKVRPCWLISVKGRKLELDGYCEELKLAFEYQGIQHYKPHKFFNKVKFEDIQRADSIKRKLCQEHGVTLIEVPYTVKLKDMEEYIRNQLSGNIQSRQGKPSYLCQ